MVATTAYNLLLNRRSPDVNKNSPMKGHQPQQRGGNSLRVWDIEGASPFPKPKSTSSPARKASLPVPANNLSPSTTILLPQDEQEHLLDEGLQGSSLGDERGGKVKATLFDFTVLYSIGLVVVVSSTLRPY